jgi:ABC-type glycerol-3-phosphate transport system substrate-binding protein
VTVPSGLPADALRAAVAAYAASGGLPVTVHALPNDAYLDTVSALLLAGSSQYDLLYLPAGSLARWVRYHALRPFAAPVDRVRFGPWLSPLVFADGLYGLPAQVDPLVLWVRADWLGSGGPPRDWEAFREAALRLNNPPNRYGAALAASEFSAGEDLAALLPGFGGQAVRVEAIRSDAEYAVILDDIPAQRALAFYADLVASGVTPRWDWPRSPPRKCCSTVTPARRPARRRSPRWSLRGFLASMG